MRYGMLLRKAVVLSLSVVVAGCGTVEVDGANPFLEDQSNEGKEDTGYLNPDGVEVEVDLEGDVVGPTYRLPDAPAEIGQFALTYLRHRKEMYLESLAEDATSDARAEWLVNGKWYTAAEVGKVPGAVLKHFRLRGVNTVLLFDAAKGATVGKTFTAKVPLKPFTIMTDAGDKCADSNDHITLSQSVYWYRWDPDHAGCNAATQDLKITLSKVMAKGKTTYLEYDRLTKDKKVTAVILFGQIGDGAISDTDTGMLGFRQMQGWLKAAGFKEATVAIGKRFTKAVAGNTVEIDLYSPHEFSGLGDFGHFGNFQKALSEHEIVVYDGHSMLGASDFWARPNYNQEYQIFLYGGCLGYEYYVRPIVDGKKGWQNVDIVSSVIEVSVGANEFAGPVLAKLLWALDHGNRASWRQMLTAIRTRVGDSTFGASGVRDNCYSPYGRLCP
ncbi:MAG: hypothetical protein EXR72_04380 [Myxococcales bacterium]|nr:hypothetical protein [Myxococcales bacterium]